MTANPVALDNESVFQKVMLIASRRNLAIHHLTVQKIGDKLAISFDLEVEGSMPLGEAHETATALEEAIRGELGSDVEVESHIEPQPERMLEGQEAPSGLTAEVEAALMDLASAYPRLSDIHSIRLRRNEEGLFLHYHCRCSPAETVENIHDDIDRVEAGLKDRFGDIRRVIAHAEPLGARPPRAVRRQPAGRQLLQLLARPGKLLDALDLAIRDLHPVGDAEGLVIGIFQRHHDGIELVDPRQVPEFEDHLGNILGRVALAVAEARHRLCRFSGGRAAPRVVSGAVACRLLSIDIPSRLSSFPVFHSIRA